MLASALSVAKLPYDQAQDGISLTDDRRSRPASAAPRTSGSRNLVGLLDALRRLAAGST